MEGKRLSLLRDAVGEFLCGNELIWLGAGDKQCSWGLVDAPEPCSCSESGGGKQCEKRVEGLGTNWAMEEPCVAHIGSLGSEGASFPAQLRCPMLW